MLERVLIATSRTELNIELLLDLIRNMPVEEVTLVHCVESVLPSPQRDRRLVHRAEQELAQGVAEAQAGSEVSLTAVVRIGNPAQQIIHVAKERGADTIAMNAFVGIPWQDFFLGSVSLDVIRYGHTNMLVLHPPAQDQEMIGGLKRPLLDHTLFPTDFSDFSLSAFDSFASLADKGMKQVSLLHVQDATRLEPHLIDRLAEFDATDSQRLEDMAQRLRDKHVAVDSRIELGVPEQSIIRVARELAVSCIAIGSRGRSPSQAALWGKVSERVVRSAQAPVLVIKQ